MLLWHNAFAQRSRWVFLFLRAGKSNNYFFGKLGKFSSSMPARFSSPSVQPSPPSSSRPPHEPSAWRTSRGESPHDHSLRDTVAIRAPPFFGLQEKTVGFHYTHRIAMQTNTLHATSWPFQKCTVATHYTFLFFMLILFIVI